MFTHQQITHFEIADDPRQFQGASELLGAPTVPTIPIATCFTSNAGWHDDDGTDLPGVKFLVHLEARTADSGALRVLPGSHEPAYQARVQRYRRRDPARQGFQGWPTPSVALETEPGDVIAFDVHLLHSSVGGSDRIAWTVAEIVDFDHKGYDRDRWPTWREWVAGARAIPSRRAALERLRLLGVVGEGDPR